MNFPFSYLHKYLPFFVLVLCFYSILPSTIIHFPGYNLDASWKIGLNMATALNFIFGEDIMFTYGPLGYLATKLPILVGRVGIYLFHFFLIVNVFYILQLIIGLISRKNYTILLLFLLFFGPLIISHRLLILFIFFIFYILFSFLKNVPALLLPASLIAILSFFIKLNTGILINFLFIGFLLFQAIIQGRRHWLRAGIYIFLHVGAIFLLSIPLKVHIPKYIRGSIHLIDAYNDAMLIEPSEPSLVVALVLLSISIILFFAKSKFWLASRNSMMLLFFVGTGIYIAFKQGYVRADQHILAFQIYFPILIGYLYLFTEHVSFKESIGICFILASILSGLSIYYLPPKINPLSTLVKIPYSGEWKNQKNYYPILEHIHQEQLAERALPENIRSAIGDQSIDIMPWSISYAYYHDLNYNPRPVFQSYTAYDSYLDSLNVNKFLSGNSADFVLFHQYDAIEQYRNGFWDESMTKLAILQTYEPVLFEDPFLLMKKRHQRLKIIELNEMEYELTWNDTLELKRSDNLQYLYADIEYNFWGKLRRFFFQPRWSNIFVFIGSRKIPKQYRAIIPILKGGVLINRDVSSSMDYYSFFAHSGIKNGRINKFFFATDKRWVRDKIKIKLKEIKLVSIH